MALGGEVKVDEAGGAVPVPQLNVELVPLLYGGVLDGRYEDNDPVDKEIPVVSDTPVDRDTSVGKLFGGPNLEVEVSTGKLTEVASVKVPVVGVLERKGSVHQSKPSLVSLQEVAVTGFVLVTTGTAGEGVTVITIWLVMTTVLRMVVEFHRPEDAGAVELTGLLDSEMPVEDGIPVAGLDNVGGGKSLLKVLLATGEEYGGGA